MRGPKRLLARHGAQADEERNGRTPVRKLVATFCAVAMSVGMAGVSMSAYADDQQPAEDATTTVEATPEVQPSEDATVGAQPEAEATDAQPEAITTDAPAVAAVGDAAPTADGDAPDFSKKVKYNNNGTYTLSMNVSGRGGETTSTTATPLDIALVLDVSGSMAWPSKKINSADIDKSETYKVDIFNNNYVTVSYRNGNWRTQSGWPVYPATTQFYSNDTRLAVLQSSIVNFLNNVNNKNGEISEAGKKIQVSLITYANSGTINQNLTSDVDDVKTALNNLTASGATNAADGLNQAHTALTPPAPGARSDSQRVVIFYSDGQPTTSNSFSPTVASNAINYAHTLKTDDKATVYSISADPDATTTGTTNTDLFMSYVSSNYPNAQGVNSPSTNNWATPGERGPGDYYTAVSGDDSLDDIFDGIFSNITQGSVFTNVSMTDTLSQYVEFVNADAVANYGAELVVHNSKGEKVTDLTVGLPTETGKTYQITSDGKTVSIEFPAGYALRDGFTYSLEYQIKPSDSAYTEYATNGYPNTGADDTGDSSAGKPGFRSNNEASISYTPRVDGAEQEVITSAFPHPVVQVHYTPTKQTPISVEKTVDGNGTWRDGDSFQFTIAAQDNAPLPADHTITIDKPADGSSATEQFGTIEYTAPGEYNYTVTETPNEQNKHYVYSKAEYDVQVKVVQTDSATPRALKIESVTWTQTKKDDGSDSNTNTPGTVMPLKFTNTAATATLAANTVKVQKTVNGTGAKWDSFGFQMTPVSAPESVTPGETLITTVTTDSPDLQAGFDELTFDTPGIYTYRVTEVKPDNAAGFQYSQASYLVTVTVKQAEDNSLTATAVVTQEKDDNGANKTGKVTGALPFTNTWVAVSNLPLTGEGGATPMLWLAIGGGLGALALLAAGGAAIWRKRRLI
ncbi:FctX protein [Bifidobacterium pseudolongum subsp. pseudolongum]|uniref:FctX protein n=1 Tax=Bifidobacterium pseudolongum subsp. pseudolongum TaxID=31954 RepID=A0A4Q5A828_9BIFI|nr:FctA domain-containing protein [Bifidobacterium pseudolongum]RYQ19712.1 FctX protein [Bifidobacterium pseudolongum subsp. pseudolongum]